MESPDWLFERGIGETRYALIENNMIVEARIARDGIVQAGTILEARLVSVGRASVAIADGQEFLMPKGAPGVTEGGRIKIEVTREALCGAEPWKRPLARMAGHQPGVEPAIRGREATAGQFENAAWDDLLDEARSGVIAVRGGELRVSLTPAMTLIDVDGHLQPSELAVAGARAAAHAIRRHGVGGSIGIDLPTAKGKDARHAAAAAVDEILPQPFERTGINGFGFLQVVRPRRNASLFELAADRPAFEARALLRRAGREIGAIRVAAHPAVIGVLGEHRNWLDALSRQVGGAVTLRSDPSLAISGGYAERP